MKLRGKHAVAPLPPRRSPRHIPCGWPRWIHLSAVDNNCARNKNGCRFDALQDRAIGFGKLYFVPADLRHLNLGIRKSHHTAFKNAEPCCRNRTPHFSRRGPDSRHRCRGTVCQWKQMRAPPRIALPPHGVDAIIKRAHARQYHGIGLRNRPRLGTSCTSPPAAVRAFCTLRTLPAP